MDSEIVRKGNCNVRLRLELVLETPGREAIEMPNQPIPKIFELIVDNAQKRRSQKADEAGKLFVLGQLTVAEYIAALNQDAAPRS
jgi:hypothetical protein